LQTGNATVSTTGLLYPLISSKQPKAANIKMTSFTGVFLLVFSVLVVVLDSSNFFAVGISFFHSVIGIMLVMVGAMGGFEKKPETAPIHTEVSGRSSRSDANTATP
jgi:predicted permease